MAKLGPVLRPDGSQEARHEFWKARPARRAFAFLALLLGGCPPFLFDKLQQHQAAIGQALKILELVNESERLTR